MAQGQVLWRVLILKPEIIAMFSKALALALLVFLAIPAAHAADIKSVAASFDLGADGSAVESLNFTFKAPTSEVLSYAVDSKVRNIQAFDSKGPLSTALNLNNGSYEIAVLLDRPVEGLVLSYDADGTVFTSDSVQHFFTDFSFDGPVNLSMSVKLPEGFALYQNSFKPDGGEIGSDGTRITLAWDLSNANYTFFSVKYIQSEDNGGILIAAVATLAGIIILLFLYFRQRSHEMFMHGFREDEKKVIDYMRERKTALQSDVQKQFGFSRAKATRVVAILEGKGLLKKQRYGRTNKLTWTR